MSVRTKIMQPNLLQDLLHDVDSTMGKQRKHRIMLKCQSTMYRLFIVLCWLWNIYEGAELPSVYFITNTKHCKTFLALPQLLPVLLTDRLHIMKYTYYVVFYCISSRSIAIGDKWIYQQHSFFILCKIIWEIFH